MAQHIPRLFVPQSLAAGGTLVIEDADRVHHLRDVLRLAVGDSAYPFNAVEGEFTATVSAVSKRAIAFVIGHQRRAPKADAKSIHLIFAPLKRANTELVVEKAAELGAARLTPVITDYTQTRTLNMERLNAMMLDAVEQCGGFAMPQLDAPAPLKSFLQAWPQHQPLHVALEAERTTNPPLAASASTILIGPEGGWSDSEIAFLKQLPFVVPVSLGPHILRAETAAIVALGAMRLGW